MWVAATQDMPAHCLVTGQLQPVDTSSTAQPIRFAVALPAMWNRRAIQLRRGGTITGEVVEVLFVNPHARYFVALEGENGNEILWDAQTRSPNALFGIGWNKDTIRVGERITIEGNLGRDNARKIWIVEVRKASGETMRPTGEEPPR